MTVQEYSKTIDKYEITQDKLPMTLWNSWDFIEKVSLNRTSWTAYETSDKIKSAVDLYLNQFNKVLSDILDIHSETTKPKKSSPSSKTKKVNVSAKSQSTKTTNKPAKIDPNIEKVEAFNDELKFIKRFVNLHGKIKMRNQIRLFVNALQKAIRDKRIRKTSKHAKPIMDIQDNLIKLHGEFKTDQSRIEVNIPEKTRVKY